MRISAVSFLNTVPLVWGLLQRPQPHIDLRFCVPARVADDLDEGVADIGIVPCGEIDRLGLSFFPETGIACTGAVRSILLISRVPPGQIRTLAADASSRTSVLLARIILSERYGSNPVVRSCPPVLADMLQSADAALVIGDPALRLDPARISHRVLDLGEEWLGLSGLPMVFAVWAGRQAALTAQARQLFLGSCLEGVANVDAIAAAAPDSHGIPEEIARVYLTRNIQFLLTPEHLKGLASYRARAAALLYSTVMT